MSKVKVSVTKKEDIILSLEKYSMNIHRVNGRVHSVTMENGAIHDSIVFGTGVDIMALINAASEVLENVDKQ